MVLAILISLYKLVRRVTVIRSGGRGQIKKFRCFINVCRLSDDLEEEPMVI